jgi:ABC-type sugar transport system ATPase subunit
MRASPSNRAASSPPPSDCLVHVDKVIKRFPGVLALDGASLKIRRGEVHALLEENGAGKSTRIKMLSGVHQPDGGSIRVRGQDVRITDPRHAQALGITTIYQEHTLAPDLSPIENDIIRKMVGREAGSMAAAAARPANEPLAEGAAEVLRATGLSRRGVLRDVSLSVRAGEIVGLGGLAGSGRT